ncbi:MAG: selenide, water dikinase SelD, partial [Gammaproteobacteria bacterium]|nr:selenide, water dikinase SelD [Gammaproteobacteria bacterium]
AGAVVPVKPIQQFIAHWEKLSRRVLAHSGPMRIGVVGAGAGGVEILLAIQFRLRQLLAAAGRNDDHLQYNLFADTERILPEHNARTRRIFQRVLAERQVRARTGKAVVEVSAGRLKRADGSEYAMDEVLWATAASAAPWLAESGLAVDDRGFVKVGEALQSLSHPEVFAAGDIAALVDHPRPKSGVFAVRAGKPLERNLRRALLGRPLAPFRPQRQFLSLISTGDKYAVASRNGWALEGRLMWRWKDWIDRRFMRKFNELPDMETADELAVPNGLADAEAIKAVSAIAMRCGGCGAKVGSTVLERALASLRPVARSDVLVGLDARDDAAVVAVPPGKVMVHTVDYFRSFIDDPYVFGQVAANHSLGDIFAMGAEPQTALAIVTIPFGLEAKVEDELRQLMAGALKVLEEANTALVGGHTGEGAELGLGFAVNGLADRDGLLRKGGMRPGDRLILTKPIGTGVLFAADMRQKAKGRWIDAALTSMIQSNRAAASCLRGYGATACTDVTGFGLLGHLIEMTKPSGVDVELDIDSVPLLDGALEMVRLGIFSSLQSQNLRLRRAIRALEAAAVDERFPLLFDPQTAGGLLASVPRDRTEDCVCELRRLGYGRAVMIGTVEVCRDSLEPITLRR